MSEVLQDALAELAKLPEDEQEELGRWLLAEIAAERRWSERFSSSQPALAKLAAETRADLAAGRTTPLDPSKL